MKKFAKTLLAATLCVAMFSMSSCIGSFTLTSRLKGWNDHVGNKFVNELVFLGFCILPVYEVCVLADALVINSIEFWSGNNPMAQSEKTIDGSDGKYLVKCDGKGYDIISCNDGSKVRLDFDVPTQTWSYTAGAQSGTLFQYVDDTHIKLPVNGGADWQVFETSDAGMLAYQQVLMPMLAAR